jgi:hypothetical protein
MADLTKDQILDFKIWFKPEGDPGFSPAWNKKIVEDSIKEYDIRRELMQKQFENTLAERTDAVSYLLRAIDLGKDTNALKYFGKSELARLRGEQIAGEVKSRFEDMKRRRDAEKKLTRSN